MSELNILAAALKERSVIEAVEVGVELNEEFTSQGRLVYGELKEYYETDQQASFVDTEIIKERLGRKHKRHAKKLKDYVDNLVTRDISATNVNKEILETKTDIVMQSLGARMINSEPYDSLVDDLNTLENLHKGEQGARSLVTHEYEVYNGKDFPGLLQATTDEDKIEVYPEILNEHIGGGLWRQGSVVVFGRPDVGKTSFIINISSGFLRAGHRVLYLANEDPVGQLLIRHIQCFRALPKQEVEKEFQSNLEISMEKGLSNLSLIETPAGTMGHLEHIVKEVRPDVLIVDQLRNMRSKQEQRTLQLEEVQRGIRALGKKYNCVTLSVTQAGGNADGVRILGMEHVDYSKTGIAGACDLLMGIGADHQMLLTGQRFLSFIKNKFNGNKEPLQVTFNLEQVRVR